LPKNDTHFAYAGKILRINLSDGRISIEPTLKYAKEWLGASGIAIKILYDELRPWVTPYEPANKLIFGAGALVGTTAPGACKSNLSTLGPMTGGWASGCSDSYVGGHLKYAGYDSVVFEGKAHSPVYLWVHDDGVELRNASDLWDKTTWETLDAVREELGDPALHTVSIGPAGENLVRGACAIQDKGRAFGRCGIGAVMGSKNLKAIVVRGTGAVRVAHPQRFMETVAMVREMFKKAKTLDTMRRYGTLGGVAKKQEVCGVNYKNFQECYLPEDVLEAINPCRSIDKYEVSRQSFPGCAVGCSRHLHLSGGPYAGLTAESCQMETLMTLQTRLAIREPTFMFKANAYCNQLGLDVDAAGGAIGWAMECFQRGILDKKDADGLKLEWGDAEVVLELIRKIAYREGFGNILAEGCAKASEIIGRNSSYYAMHIKGQDLYEPCRGALGWCLGTTTSTRGGGHTTGAVGDARPGLGLGKEKAIQIFGVDNPHKPLEYEGKAKMVMYMEILHRVNNSLGICHMNTIHWDFEQIDLPQLADLYSAATEWETSVEDLKRIALRQLNLEKAFNLRYTDFDRKDDLPTPRDMNEPIPTGPLAGWKMDKEKFNRMLDEYYDLHGWDKKTSYPTRKTLADLDLDHVADDLERMGKLGQG
jgi:aldehyde:ferredoxin oxidoreductase